MTYKEQIEHPLWQKKRLEILQRDKFTCQICLDTETQLQVHHKEYGKGKKAWEYQNYVYQTLCKFCHKDLTEHIKKHQTEEEFAVMRRNDVRFVYSKGLLIVQNKEDFLIGFSEQTLLKLTHFLIDNLINKNG